MIKELLMDAFFAGVAAAGFGAMANAHKRYLFFTALIAGLGHAFRYYLMNSALALPLVPSTFLAAFLISLMGFLFAYKSETASEVITFPALLPMIPGLLAYNTVLYSVNFLKTSDMLEASQLLVKIYTNGLTVSAVLLALVLGASLTVFIDTISTKNKTQKIIKKRLHLNISSMLHLKK